MTALPPADKPDQPSQGVVECRKCGQSWPWSEAPRDTWRSPYQFTWDNERAALAYLNQHVCGRRHMEVRRRV